MPSPFPGMDPFLEHPHFFAGLHGAMHTYIREALQARLPEPYFAEINERVWIETSARYVEPDTTVIQGVDVVRSETGGVAVAARTQPLVFEVTDDERTEMEVEIRTRRDDEGERLVTVIEVLSLANKTPGEKGRDLYLEKQREVLGSPVHLVEIDLLRGANTRLPCPWKGFAARPVRTTTTCPCIDSTSRAGSSFTPGNWRTPSPSSPFPCCRATARCRWTWGPSSPAATTAGPIGAA